MSSRLTLPQQRTLYRALPAQRRMMVKKHCRECAMKGQGIMDILKSISNILGPIAKELGPTILKEIIVPLIKKKMEGGGLHTPGGALRLAGQRGPKGRGKKGGAYM